MRKLALLSVVALLVSVPASAQFQQMVEVLVKPGQEQAFEGFIKKLAEGADKNASPLSWNTFNVAIGKDNPTYRIGLQFQTWAERDSWEGGPLAVLVKAFGEEEGSKIYRQGQSAVARSSTRVWELIEEGSANPQTADDGIAKFYEVTIRWVDPTKLAEHQGLLRRFKSAYEAHDSKPSVSRWVLRFGTGQNTVFRRTQPFDNWAQRDGWDPIEALTKQFGPDTPLLIDRLNAGVLKTEHFVSAHRPDLSRSAGGSTSND